MSQVNKNVNTVILGVAFVSGCVYIISAQESTTFNCAVIY
jgi:hypothetical protein